MARIHEVIDVSPEHQPRWLAGQIDEVERKNKEAHQALESRFSEEMNRFTAELGATRRVLTGILIALLTASLTIPIGLIWAAAVK